MKRSRGSLFYVFMAVAGVVTVLLVLYLAPGALPEPQPVVLAAPPTAAASPAPSPVRAPELEIIAVTPDTVQTVLRTLSRADSYSRTLTVQRFWSSGSSVSTIDIWARGELHRIAIRSGGRNRVKNILLSGSEKWIWYSDSLHAFSSAAAEAEADRWETLYTYERIETLEPQSIFSADFVEFNGENCIFVHFQDSVLPYESLCYISCDTGLLMGEDMYDGNSLIYSMRSTLPDISTPEMEVFQPPAP